MGVKPTFNFLAGTFLTPPHFLRNLIGVNTLLRGAKIMPPCLQQDLLSKTLTFDRAATEPAGEALASYPAGSNLPISANQISEVGKVRSLLSHHGTGYVSSTLRRRIR